VGELNHHLKSETTELDDPVPENASRGNSRNDYSKKTVQSDHDEMDLAIPRDRQGKFEPVLVPKHQRRLAGLDEKILVLYARGLSTRDISAQLEELYGVNISPALISEVTDSVSDEVKAWQVRPLDEVYPVGFPQAIEALYPKTQVQLCIVHLIRNCLHYVPWKDSKAVAADLKPIYQATTLEEAEAALDAFAAKWDALYPAIS
jgi:putative transposase